jgi:hypothetical protein
MAGLHLGVANLNCTHGTAKLVVVSYDQLPLIFYVLFGSDFSWVLKRQFRHAENGHEHGQNDKADDQTHA